MKRPLLAACAAACCLACHGSGTMTPNREPETTMANVPLENTPDRPYLAVLRLSWNGSDPDGYIVGYEYRWTTYHLVRGDSIEMPWRFTTRADTTFAFESSDSINHQVFLVRARDNEGAVDPTPARKRLYTAQVQPPDTRIPSPSDGATLYVLPTMTDTWRGITIRFEGEDSDGAVVDYAWRIDAREWSAHNPATSATLSWGDFPPPVAGPHTFSVKARDNTMVEDPTPAVISFTLVQPSFDRGILVVDETRDGAGTPEAPTDAEVDAFYASVLGARQTDEWDFATDRVPPKEVLGRYRVVLWHTDDMVPEVTVALEELSAYLDVGGKLLLGGWKILTAISGASTEATFTEGFPRDYLHLARMNHVPGTLWRGGIGTGDWDWATVRPDTAKLRPNRRGNLPEVDTLEPSTVFCEPILLFDHLREDSTVHLKPCATYYHGTTYDVAYFGFPLFYTKAEHIEPLLDDLLRRMGE